VASLKYKNPSDGLWYYLQAGPKGDTGATGPSGSQGPPGAQGPQGIQGATGSQGPKGDTGSQGPQGPTGNTGSQGPAGTAATATAGTTVTGAPGTNAAVVNAGTTSAAIFNFTIPRGDVGAQGPTGSTGSQGPKGDTGSQGPQGPKGDTGSQGPAGPSGATGITVKDEGSNMGAGITTLDFQGTGVVATPIGGGEVIVTVTGGGGGGAPTGPAGGDLSGTYPNPVVEKSSAATFDLAGSINWANGMSINSDTPSSALVLNPGGTGWINASGSVIGAVASPTNAQDAVNKDYSDRIIMIQTSQPAGLPTELWVDTDDTLSDDQLLAIMKNPPRCYLQFPVVSHATGWTLFTTATVLYQKGGATGTNGSRINVPYAGLYHIDAQVYFQAGSAGSNGSRRGIYVGRNAAGAPAANGIQQLLFGCEKDVAVQAGATCSFDYELAANDYLELSGYHDAGAALNNLAASGSFMNVRWVAPL
jgi:hypothetical protein